MRGINDAFNKSKKYAAAIILSFHPVTGRLAFSNAGHSPPLWHHAGQRSPGWLEEQNNSQLKKVAGLPVGLPHFLERGVEPGVQATTYSSRITSLA